MMLSLYLERLKPLERLERKVADCSKRSKGSKSSNRLRDSKET
jgi:hypothetical protein